VEKAFRESEERFNRLAQASLEGIAIHEKGRILDANQVFVDLFGYELSEIIGMNVLDLATPESLDVVRNNFLMSYEKPYEAMGLRKDGTVFVGELRGKSISYHGRTVRVTVVHDITERKQAEKQIILLAHTMKSVAECVSITDINDTFLFVNNAFLKTYGYTEHEILGKNVNVVRSPNNPPEATRGILAATLAGGWSGELLNRTKDGRDFPVSLSTSVVRDEQGQDIALVGVATDITERKLAEEALKESQALYYSFIEQLPNAVFRKDREGRYVLVNSQFCKLKGLEKENFIGRKPKEVAESEIAVQTKQGHAKEYANSGEDAHELIMRTGEIIEAEEEYPDIDGSIRYMDVVRMPVFDYQGTVIGTQGIMFDVTERKKAEKALRINEERLNELFEEAPFGYHEMDEFGNICAVNRAELKMLGFTKEEMIGMPAWRDISDSEEARKRIFGKLAGKVPPNKNSERLVVRKDGTSFPALIDDVILRNEEGKITGIRTTLLDITDRKRAEEALRETRDYLENLLSFANIPIIVWDPNFKITRFNLAIEKLTGYSIHEVIGKHLEILLPLENRKSSLSLIVPTSEGDHLITAEIPILCKNGNVRTLIWSSANIYAADGQTLVSTIAQGQDITEQKKLQQELLQSQKMESIGTLAGGIAHDFNNILGIILGYASLMEKGTLSPEKFNESLGIIKNAVGRGAALVGQILTFARKTDIVFNPIDVTDLIHELLSMLRQTFPKVITFIEIIGKDIPLISADRIQIHQVMLNLCVNARDAMPNGGTITIKVDKQTKSQVQEKIPVADQDSYICISMTDTGVGMDEATCRQIFDPFFTTKEKGKGTGLGLSVVYGVIQSHHGFIDVESEVGRGTTFWLYFPIPLASEQSADVSLLTEPFATGGTETILLVEDEKVLIEIVRLLLESNGYKVYIANDGNEAINVYKLHKQEIDLVLTDMGLPGMSGMDVLKKLREINPNVNIVTASGFFEQDVKSKLTAYGAKGFIQKPYTPDVVLKKIREVLDAKNN
jgi:PAS domain S-box-containing protein